MHDMHDLQAQERTSLRLPFWLQFLIVSGASVGLGWLLFRGITALPSFSLLLHTLLRQIPRWLWELLFAFALVLVGLSLKEGYKGEQEQQEQRQRQKRLPNALSTVTRFPSSPSPTKRAHPFPDNGASLPLQHPQPRPPFPTVAQVHPDPVTPVPEVLSPGEESKEPPALPAAELSHPSSVQPETSAAPIPAPLLTLVPTTLSVPSLPASPTLAVSPEGRGVHEDEHLEVVSSAFLAITVLGQVTLTLHLPDGRSHPIELTPLQAQLLAYLAALHGNRVHRREIVYALCEWRSEDGTGDDTSFAKLFYGRVKGIRRKIREEVLKLNDEAGFLLLDPATVDPLSSVKEEWFLTSCCRVVDLEQIEALSAHIEQARKEGALTTTVPTAIKTVCEQLLAFYTEDFIADLIKNEPENFKPWERKASWAKQHVTKYRTCRLMALWLLGMYEEQQAERCSRLLDTLLAGEGGKIGEGFHAELEAVLRPLMLQLYGDQAGPQRVLSREQLMETLRSRQRLSWSKALDAYRHYALTACITPYYPGLPFDELVSYHATSGGFGDRIVASEQALRRALKACASLNDTREAARIYSAYEDVMTGLFKAWGLKWSPSEETLKEWHTASSLTDAHRFSGQSFSSTI